MSDLAFQIMSSLMDSEPADPDDYAMVCGHIVSNDFVHQVERLTQYLINVHARKSGVEVEHEF